MFSCKPGPCFRLCSETGTCVGKRFNFNLIIPFLLYEKERVVGRDGNPAKQKT